MTREYHLHLISDATGETLNTVAKAVAAQFEGNSAREHIYSLVRTERQLYRAVEHIAQNPGVVFFTLVNPSLRKILESECRKLHVPCVSILDRAVEVSRRERGPAEAELGEQVKVAELRRDRGVPGPRTIRLVEREVQVPEHDGRGLAEGPHGAQRRERGGAAVHEVAGEPEPVAARVEADPVEQREEFRVAALQVADRPERHARAPA